MEIEILLVCIGNFQEYILYNITQLIELGYKINFIGEQKFFNELKDFDINLIDAAEFESFTEFDKRTWGSFKYFRQGFWVHTSKRFFLIHDYMKKYEKKNIIHLENDVLLYYNFNNMDIKFENKLHLTMDCDTRCIPGIVYIPDYTFIEGLFEKYDYVLNDMQNMSDYYNRCKNLCLTLPIIQKNIHYNSNDLLTRNQDQFEGIFDAAAIGQYLGGIDPKNINDMLAHDKFRDVSKFGPGHINNRCWVDYSKYNIIWKKNEKGYNLPYIVLDDKDIPIYNLHIHCKNLEKFTMIDYE
tara:strand:+ start:234 stop:1124 length:891 start_codon:yes stop_codon:yes gene_type:complete